MRRFQINWLKSWLRRSDDADDDGSMLESSLRPVSGSMLLRRTNKILLIYYELNRVFIISIISVKS